MSSLTYAGRLATPPNGLDGVRAVYGDPGPWIRPDGEVMRSWEAHILTHVELPAPLPLSWAPDVSVQRIRVHKLLAVNLREVLADIHRAGLWGPHAPREGINSFAGSYNWRRQRGGRKPSLHCWGAAIDFDSAELPIGREADPSELSLDVVAIWERHGWTWGGRWSRPDPMHVQFCVGL